MKSTGRNAAPESSVMIAEVGTNRGCMCFATVPGLRTSLVPQTYPRSMEAQMARSAARLGILTLALLALAACAAAPTATAPAPQPVATLAPPVSPDQDFLNRAATGTGSQIELGRLAQERGLASPVRAFGARIA